MAKKKSILQFFSETSSDWESTEDAYMLSAKELKAVTECTAKLYNGEFGRFAKLYLSVEIDGKSLTLKGDPDSAGVARSGVKLDAKSMRRIHFNEDDEEVEVDPAKVKLYFIKHKETGEERMRIRILL